MYGDRISEYMDLTPAEVVGHTCYHFIHVEDLENLRQSHEDCESQTHACICDNSYLLMKKSNFILSCCYRRPLLTRQ